MKLAVVVIFMSPRRKERVPAVPLASKMEASGNSDTSPSNGNSYKLPGFADGSGHFASQNQEQTVRGKENSEFCCHFVILR
ncbi:hypothetical protein TNCT_525151 [Trichonephila clavata]|uniref:Uncharacterized protein n=1 Tax=Trichonephila clavata TaxID=2740835 RepID=A0A8X6HKJ7_TRICU|nr:hypothetical protein TNCT_525151 [Trichonephila clavata]